MDITKIEFQKYRYDESIEYALLDSRETSDLLNACNWQKITVEDSPLSEKEFKYYKTEEYPYALILDIGIGIGNRFFHTTEDMVRYLAALKVDIERSAKNKQVHQNHNATVAPIVFDMLSKRGDFKNEQDFIAALMEKIQAPHALEGLFLGTECFEKNEQEYLSILTQKMHIPKNELNFSLESIKTIDANYKSVYDLEDDYAQLFTAIVYYLGEVYIKEDQGAYWKLEKQVGSQSYYPAIIQSNGDYFSIGIYVFEEIVEKNMHDLHGLIDVYLHPLFDNNGVVLYPEERKKLGRQ